MVASSHFCCAGGISQRILYFAHEFTRLFQQHPSSNLIYYFKKVTAQWYCLRLLGGWEVYNGAQKNLLLGKCTHCGCNCKIEKCKGVHVQ